MSIWNWRCWFGHDFSAWAHIPSRCVKEKFCKTCQIVENKPEHRFGPWSISMAKTLVTDVHGKQHSYDDHTIQIHKCLDCNYTQHEAY